jgi:alcohol dehydrogenase class IV
VTAFEFTSPARVVFGPGRLAELGPAAAGMGKRALLVAGMGQERSRPVQALLEAAGVQASLFQLDGEPSLEAVSQAAALAAADRCDLVIALGGGSALDAGKAAAALVTNPGDIYDYLEVVGRGRSISHAPLPLIAVPTTAGAGAEVTRNAVLSVPEHRVKVSMRSPLMLPRLALVDPELTLSLPPAVTAATGLDALTQLIEPYLTPRANPLTDALCRDGIPRAARALPRAFHHGNDLAARTEMSLASLYGGFALANAGLGAVHGFAAPLGGELNAPHGAICARLLPVVFAANQRALLERSPDSPLLERFDEVARMLTGSPTARAADGAAWLHDLVRELDIPRLAAYGLDPAGLPALAEKAAQASSMKANPVMLTHAELVGILKHAL